MLIPSTRHQIPAGAALLLLFVVTRGYHTPTLLHALPSASWAVFFLAGVYLRPVWVFPALLMLAATLDYVAIAFGGVSDFCISPAYVALIPAYGMLWLAGRTYARYFSFSAATLLPLLATVFTGTLACELISSGSFYFFSGRFTDPAYMEFAARVMKYLPHNLGAMLFWVVLAAVLHAVVTMTYRQTQKIRPL